MLEREEGVLSEEMGRFNDIIKGEAKKAAEAEEKAENLMHELFDTGKSVKRAGDELEIKVRRFEELMGELSKCLAIIGKHSPRKEEALKKELEKIVNDVTGVKTGIENKKEIFQKCIDENKEKRYSIINNTSK